MSKEDFGKYIASKNLVDEVDSETLLHMGQQVVEWVDIDEAARMEWKTRFEEHLKLASQVREAKNTPWPNASNIKFPLLTTAAMQFAARAYPALVPGPNLVAGLVIGRDEGGLKQQSARRVGRHMSYQLLYEMPDWEEEMDKLCHILPIAGCLFKKTYFDQLEKRNVSELILPMDLVIDYYAKSVETAERKCHYIYKTDNEIIERINAGLYKDQSYGEPTGDTETKTVSNQIDGKQEPALTPATTHKFVECHCRWDLDYDGYAEPYIVTVHYETRRVARIITRFDIDGIETTINEKTGKEKLVRIKATEYFTKFGFIPNPDGSIYDVGFGLLLGGINESVNTLTNQLLDSGHLHVLQAGFLGRGIRARGGTTKFIPGEWKPMDFTGDDIRKHIFPLPTKEPPDVLLKLLELMVTSGKELASIAEIFVGKMPGQNTPATTTMATIEQGLKVFTAIYKRIYRALNKEYQKLYALNTIHLPVDKVYFTINEPEGPQNSEIARQDYNKASISVKPNADPNIVSSAQKLMKVQSYGPLLKLGTINPKEYTRRYLEAVEAENISALTSADPKPQQPGQPRQQRQPYQPPPSPEQQKLQGEMQAKQADAQNKAKQTQADGMLKAQQAQQQAQIKAFEAQLEKQDKELDLRIKAAQAQLDERAAQIEAMQTLQEARIEAITTAISNKQDLRHKEQDHQQDLRHTEEMSKAKVEAIKKQAAAKPKTKEGK